MKITKTLYVKDRKAWRKWLVKNHSRKNEIWLIYYKKSSGKKRISYDAAVEEALCYGWIDSIAKSIDNERYVQRFSKRKPTSGLSQMNLERVRRLISLGKMTKAGLAAINHVFNPGKDRAQAFQVPAGILKALKSDRAAWRNFQKLPLAYRRVRIAFIESRKRHGMAQYRRSLKHFIEMTAKNKRFGFIRPDLRS